MLERRMESLHSDAIVIDGLIIARWERSVFESMHSAGLTAASCTCSVWEDFKGTMANIAQFKDWIDENSDILRQVYTTEDILTAKSEGKVGIILSLQNISGMEDRIPYLRLFKELGVGIIQLAYNTQNLVGSGCYETSDSGLSDFGREVLSKMNDIGIVADLSHVGTRTSRDVILASRKPVLYSHTCPAELKPHPRNRSDEDLRLIVEHGGFVGVTPFPWFLAAGQNASIEDYIDAIEYTINVVGEDSVGIGTDFTDGYDARFTEWVIRDKGYARIVTGQRVDEIEPTVMPQGLRCIREFPNITSEMERCHWPEARISKVLGENLLSFLRNVWGG